MSFFTESRGKEQKMSLAEITFQRRRKLALALAAFILTLSCGLAAALYFRPPRDWMSAQDTSNLHRIAGTWRGKWHGVEAVNLQLESACAPLNGTVRFYRLTKTAEGFQADGHTDDLPLMNPKFDGETLSFHVSNQARHGELIEAEMEMRMVDENRAELRRVGGIPANTSEDTQTVIEMARD